MANDSSALVQKLWNYCNVLRDDGMSYGDYVEQLTYLLFLKMADERTQPPYQPAFLPVRDRTQTGKNPNHNSFISNGHVECSHVSWVPASARTTNVRRLVSRQEHHSQSNWANPLLFSFYCRRTLSINSLYCSVLLG